MAEGNRSRRADEVNPRSVQIGKLELSQLERVTAQSHERRAVKEHPASPSIFWLCLRCRAAFIPRMTSAMSAFQKAASLIAPSLHTALCPPVSDIITYPTFYRTLAGAAATNAQCWMHVPRKLAWLQTDGTCSRCRQSAIHQGLSITVQPPACGA